MEDFLERIQLIQRKQLKLPITKPQFISSFRRNVDEGDIGVFSGAFEAFSSSKNKYKGTISNSEFEIRRRRKFLDRGTYLANVKGKFRQREDYTTVDLEINGFHFLIIPFYLLTITSYIFMLSSMEFKTLDFHSLFFIAHALLMFGIPYFVMRKRVKNTASDIEKELFFMTKKIDDYNL